MFHSLLGNAVIVFKTQHDLLNICYNNIVVNKNKTNELLNVAFNDPQLKWLKLISRYLENID